MKPLLIKGGRVVDPEASLDSLRDVRLRDGIIAEIGQDLQAAAEDEVLDAREAVVAPGFIDMHVHLRQPGFPKKETLSTGTEAAARGGFTSVACMPNTRPSLDDAEVITGLLARVEREAHCRVYPIAAITRGRLGREPCDYRALAIAGAVAFSDDGDTVDDAAVMREAALLSRDLEPPIVAHCMPEVPIVARDLHIAAETQKRWHFAHVSTAAALDLIREAKARSVGVTCEVTPHHLTFTDELFRELGAAVKVHPPLRSAEDVEVLRRGVRDGTIDVFASDHAPHTAKEKEGDPERAAPGFSGLEVAVGAYAAALPGLPLTRFVELLSTNPARIFHLRGGSLRIGGSADVTIFAERKWTVDPSRFASKGRCTPFAGRSLPRKVLATIVGGDMRYRAAELRSPA
jgi:dihydroorotase